MPIVNVKLVQCYRGQRTIKFQRSTAELNKALLSYELRENCHFELHKNDCIIRVQNRSQCLVVLNYFL